MFVLGDDKVKCLPCFGCTAAPSMLLACFFARTWRPSVVLSYLIRMTLYIILYQYYTE